MTDAHVAGVVVGIDDRGDLLVSTQSGEPQGFLVRKGRQPVQLRAPDLTSQYVEPAALNNRSVSVGSARGTDLRTHPVQWSATGVPTRLAPAPGDDPDGVAPQPVDINDRGVVLGNDAGTIVEWTSPSVVRAVVLKRTTGPAVARALNNRGVIAGSVAGHAALIGADGRVHPLGRLAGERYSVADDVNDSGVAIGSVTTRAGTFPVRWDANGAPQRIGGASTTVTAIGDDGTIVGSVYDATTVTTRAVARSAAGTVTYLRPLPNGLGTSAIAVNDLGVVGGETDFQGYAEATVWTP